MTDETPRKRTRRSPAPDGGSGSTAGAAGSGGRSDPDAALERLASLTGGDPAAEAPLPPSPAVSVYPSAPAGRPERPMGSSRRTPRARPRPADGPDSTRMIARIAVPVVFLIAVIAFIGIVTQSGVLGGPDTPAPTPAAKATKTGGGTTVVVTKKYVVKSGDSMSGIAARFDTSVSELKKLNPELGATLLVGTKIVVPAQ